MGTEITKQQQPQEQLETWKSSYRNHWEIAFKEFMFLMAEQYSLELSVRVQGRTVDSPMVKFWRDSLKELTPNQMREGLKRYMESERRSFKPAPGDIKDNAADVEPNDAPRRTIKNDCPDCKGTGWRYLEGEKRQVARCECIRIEYRGEQFFPVVVRVRPALPASPDDLQATAKKLPGIDAVKKMPEVRTQFTVTDPQREAELERQKQALLKQERARASAGDKDGD